MDLGEPEEIVEVETPTFPQETPAPTPVPQREREPQPV